MSSSIPIARSNTIQVSTSPTNSYKAASPLSAHSPPWNTISLASTGAGAIRQPRVLHPFATGELKLLLLENISQEAVATFKAQGYQVDWFPKAWGENELVEKIGNYHAIGIRSKTRITEKVLKAASKVSRSPSCYTLPSLESNSSNSF
jgi:D-3-phosphoglycerate dehydrogenase